MWGRGKGSVLVQGTGASPASYRHNFLVERVKQTGSHTDVSLCINGRNRKTRKYRNINFTFYGNNSRNKKNAVTNISDPDGTIG